MPYTLRKKTYCNADWTRVVPEDHPDVAYVVGAAGQVIPDDLAERLGLIEKPAKKPRPKRSGAGKGKKQ